MSKSDHGVKVLSSCKLSRIRHTNPPTHIVKQIWESILEMIAEKVIDLRPHRHEPRAIKK